jgi:outer membrane lipoprotein-sorting protein
MIKAMREATSLYYECDYRVGVDDVGWQRATYRVWLKKPNHFRLEASRFGSDVVNGVVIGDGSHMWIYWPGGKPRREWEHSGAAAQEYETHRTTFYIKKRTPLGGHSIGHQTGKLGAGMGMTILDPSTFHGYTDSLQPYIDAVRRSGTESVGGEPCDVIEVSLMNHQRSWHLWLSRKDHLPRKLKEVVRLSEVAVVCHERWSDVAVNAEISDDKVAWSPPPGWREWKEPPKEARLLKAGTQAPDFELASIDGTPIRLSDYRGSFVWMNKWRAG